MNENIIGIGEYQIAANNGSDIKTYALGSCVAVTVYDRKRQIGGMIHIALPDSKIDLDKSRKNPAYFADTGIGILIKKMIAKGAKRHDLEIKMAGGANVLDTSINFDIGKRNVLAVKKILWRNNLGVIAEDVEGKICRTVTLLLDSGELLISSGKKKWQI